ncbi:transcriptional regulator [Bacillus safensis]|uniref:Putative transcriptional regulatory protein pdtaR n=1 Tax=Bacillus safensis TaxID=561879 RepID=A0A5C0WH73_BACIA|nr:MULTISPECIES: response regulator [Bacillus]KRE19103.1 transcriptional regulator [Bacillus sp. Root920]MBG9823673.1 transcriptional regulator [Bacillus safensis]MBG9833434.1 transcriptional regulator [Bacillus safensis]MBG9862390.1 transcriptional regulator [Bacillus safensis]MBG9898323.1 transcriptional regulator [Bacillus safensis]
MRFFIVDDDEAVRSSLAQLIEDEELGIVAGEAEDGAELTASYLNDLHIDILCIDLLMPERDGLETIRAIKDEFHGKYLMLSQVETKELIGQAYTLGVEYYVTKPINRVEVLSVLHLMIERLHLEHSIENIQHSLKSVMQFQQRGQTKTKQRGKSLAEAGQFLLAELGIVGEKGSKDLLDMILFTDQYLALHADQHDSFPSLKIIFTGITEDKLSEPYTSADIAREAKAAEQRVRRAINQSLKHIASLGLTDFSHPTFENYASKFFDFTIVRKKMSELTKEMSGREEHTRINVKKFVQVLYYEAKRIFMED